MKEIKIQSSLSSGFTNEFDNVVSLQIDNKAFAAGGFGEVFHVIGVNGNKTKTKQVAKILFDSKDAVSLANYSTIRELQKKMKVEFEDFSNGGSADFFSEYPAFLGLPQLSFKGILNGKVILGFISNNLKELGYEEFTEILNNPNLLDQYQSLSLDNKVRIAFHLITAFQLLSKHFFVHADLKPDCLFINMKTNSCAIIDYDSGAITDDPNQKLTTWGTPGDTVAPEIFEQLKKIKGQQGEVEVNLFSDLWSMTILIHYLLFTFHPLFFLSELSPRSIRDFLQKSNQRWPQADKTSKYFNTDYTNQYDAYQNYINNNLPIDIKDKLSDTINEGYLNPVRRTSYDQWRRAFDKSQVPPKVVSFESDKQYVLEGVKALLSWEVTNAKRITIDKLGEVVGNQIEASPSSETTYKLTAENVFGKDHKSITVKTFPTPRIKSVMIPTPDINVSTNINQIALNTPKLNLTSPRLNHNLEIKEISLNRDLMEIQPSISPYKTLDRISRIYETIRKYINENIE
jgi:serine/threonine protein kinase